MDAPTPRELADDERLTQFGSRREPPTFRSAPRQSDMGALSMLLGELTVEQAAYYVRRTRKPAVDNGGNVVDEVRHASVGGLRGATFSVYHSPHPRNPLHVSVEHEGIWDDDVREAFDRCF
jgi:hypothetical protein